MIGKKEEQEMLTMTCLGIAVGIDLLFRVKDMENMIIPTTLTPAKMKSKMEREDYLNFALENMCLDEESSMAIKRYFNNENIRVFSNFEMEIAMGMDMHIYSKQKAKSSRKDYGGHSLALLLFAESATSLFSEENLWKERFLDREHHISPICQSFDTDTRDLEFIMKHIAKRNEKDGKIHKAKLDAYFSLTLEASSENREISCAEPKVDAERDQGHGPGIEL